jgi:hypothetical protein
LDITSLNWQPPRDFIRAVNSPDARTSLAKVRDQLAIAHSRLQQAEFAIDELVSHLVRIENDTIVPSNGYHLPSDADLEFIAIFHALQAELTEPACLDSLDLPLTKRLCEQFSLNVGTYLTRPFLNHQLSKLRKSPYFFTASSSDRTILFSQQHIRSRHKQLPIEISNSLSAITDWTGKDVHQVLPSVL